MAVCGVVWLACVLLASTEGTLYDDDYDSYTRTYDYNGAGKHLILFFVKKQKRSNKEFVAEF